MSELMSNPKAFGYDLEVAKNIFTAYFINIATGEESCFVVSSVEGRQQNMLVSLLTFIESEDVEILMGFNNEAFDDRLLSYIQQNKVALSSVTIAQFNIYIYQAAQLIINNDRRLKIKRDRSFESVDIFKTLGYKRARVGLKKCAVALRNPVVQDLPFKYDQPIPTGMVDELIMYNREDVLNTINTARVHDDAFVLREFLGDKYNTNLLSADNTYLSKIIFIDKFNSKVPVEYQIDMRNLRKWRTKRDKILLRGVIFDNIEFETQEFKDILDDLKNIEVHVKDDKLLVWCEDKEKWKELQYEFTIDDIKYTIGLGGLHDKEKKWVLEADDDNIIVEMDGSAYYPTLMIHFGLVPEHFRAVEKEFAATIQELKDERLFFKHHPEPTVFTKLSDAALKIAINSLFGLFGSSFFAFYDPKCVLQTTVNGQLGLLKAIEMVKLKGMKVSSANTDGIVIKTHKDNLPILEEICVEWKKVFGVDLEISHFKKIIQSHVNSYIWETTSGKLKQKGEFTPISNRDFSKDHSQAVVVEALNQYFINGVSIETTIKNCTNIYDFCISKRVGTEKASGLPYKLYTTDMNDNPLEEQQKTTRFYASKTGVLLRSVGQTRSSAITGLKGQPCTIYNRHIEQDFDSYNVDYDYYIKKAAKIVAAFN